MKRAIVLALLSLFILAAPAGGDERYESQLDRGINNSDTFSYLLLKQARENRSDAAETLKKAVAYAPDLPATYFALAGASFSLSGSGILKSVDYLVQGVAAYSRNFWWSFTLAGSLFLTLVISFLFSVVALVVIRIFADLALVAHDFREGNLNPFLLAAFFIISVFSPLLFIAGLLMLLGLYMRKVDRTLAYLFLCSLILFPVMQNTASRFFNAYSSGNVRAVVTVNDSQDNGYALAALKNPDDFVPLFSYALALKREGRYEEAIAAYKRILDRKPDARVYVNLGNCYVGLYNFEETGKYHLEEALRNYQAAINLKPLASAYYDLSQISREMLDFSKGDEYFRSAVAIDRDKVEGYRSFYSRNPNRAVADETLPAEELWEYVWQKAARVPNFGITRIPAPFLSAAALLLIAAFYQLNKRLTRRAYRCRKCGVILCPRCEKRLTWGQMCPQCYGSLIKLDELDSKERVARLLSIYAKQRRRRSTLKVLSFLLPGASQIYAGRVLKGFFLLWPFAFCLILPVTNSFFVPINSLASHSFFNWTALYIAAVLYFIANLITRRRIARGWL